MQKGCHSAVEVRQRKPGTKLDKRKGGRYAGRVRLAIVLDRSADSLCGFVDSAITPGTQIITDDWSGYASLGTRGYKHLAVAEGGAIPRWPRSHPLHPLSLLAEAHPYFDKSLLRALSVEGTTGD
jgi:hypothetical protein